MFPSPIAKASIPVRITYGLALAVCLAAWLMPLFGVALTSMRSLDDLNRGNYWGWPNGLDAIANYKAVFATSRLGRFIANSFAVTIPAVVGAVALSTMAGFALAKYRFRGNLALLAIFIAGNLVPFQILMIPVRDLMVGLGIHDTRLALILFHVSFQTGFCTLFMRNFIRQVPDALIDAARVEGLGEFGVFWFIVLPLVRPAMAAVGALVFTFVWNDYFWSLVLVQSDDVRPVTAALQSLRGMWLTSWHLLSAGSLMAAVPPVALFFLMQRQFITGLTSGAVEE